MGILIILGILVALLVILLLMGIILPSDNSFENKDVQEREAEGVEE